MKFKLVSLLSIGLLLLNFYSLAAGEKAPESVTRLARTELVKIGSDQTIVRAVKLENAKQKSLSQIQAMDEKWKATAGIADFMKAFMQNDCATVLNKIVESKQFFAEIFVMDNQGANVCQTDKTSDYWQGDEAKFNKSFANGSGAVFVDDVEFDDSTQAYLVQVSVPVMDSGKAIGAITFGIDVDKVE